MNVIDINQYPTIGAAFFEAASRYADHSLLAVPPNQSRRYAPQGLELRRGRLPTVLRWQRIFERLLPVQGVLGILESRGQILVGVEALRLLA